MHTQFLVNLNIWEGILGNDIVDSYFFESTLNIESYLHLLKLHNILRSTEMLGNDDELDVTFQQDVVSPHSEIQVWTSLICYNCYYKYFLCIVKTLTKIVLL